jgi:hypothetical protein
MKRTQGLCLPHRGRDLVDDRHRKLVGNPRR